MTVSKVKEIINSQSENKYHDENSTIATAEVNDSQTEFISGVAIGDDIVSREGSRIELKSIFFRGYVDGNQTMNRDHIVRILIWSAKDCQGAVPDFAPTDVLVADAVERHRDVNHLSEYQVWYDKSIVLPMRQPRLNSSLAREANLIIPTRYLKWYHSFKKPIKIRYTGDTALIASASCNAFFITIMTNAVDGEEPSFTYSVRLRFKDL